MVTWCREEEPQTQGLYVATQTSPFCTCFLSDHTPHCLCYMPFCLTRICPCLPGGWYACVETSDVLHDWNVDYFIKVCVVLPTLTFGHPHLWHVAFRKSHTEECLPWAESGSPPTACFIFYYFVAHYKSVSKPLYSYQECLPAPATLLTMDREENPGYTRDGQGQGWASLAKGETKYPIR